MAVLLALALPHAAGAQERRGVLLVAKPDLPDPNFARTVLVVGQDERGGTLGVVLNRPARVSLAQLMDNDPRFAAFTEPMYRGGPVEPLGLFALFRAVQAPGPALRIADDLWLALLPETLERLLADPPSQLRLYVGYAGWAPGQLAAEIDRGSWWALEPDPDLAFRPDTRGLWDELATRASSLRTRRERALPIAIVDHALPGERIAARCAPLPCGSDRAALPPACIASAGALALAGERARRPGAER